MDLQKAVDETVDSVTGATGWVIRYVKGTTLLILHPMKFAIIFQECPMVDRSALVSH
jgi:hypothetical protein